MTDEPKEPTDQEIAKRRDEVLRRMGKQPPETHDEMVRRLRKEKSKGKGKPAK